MTRQIRVPWPFRLKTFSSTAVHCPACRPAPVGRSPCKSARRGGIRTFSRGCARSLRPSRRLLPRRARQASRRRGRRFAGLVECHHAYLFQPCTIRAGHMIYRVSHRTTYDYEDPVSVAHHLVRLTPRNLPAQVARETKILIDPAPPYHHS